MKIALVYDRVNKIGGAERVLTAVHEIWPNAPLYTAVYHPSSSAWADNFQIIPSFLQKIPGATTHHELLPLLTPYAFESFNLDQYEIIISVTSADAKAVITKPHQLHFCYLLTPTRYLWSHAEEYASNNFLKRYFINNLKPWDLVAASRPDKYICISQAVASRCQKYYHRNVDKIIYPPVDTQLFASTSTLHRDSFYLLVSRLVPYKKVDLAIQAFNQLKLPLTIVGSGSEYNRLRRLANNNITFTGLITDYELNDLYHQAHALIFPQEEEFGITLLEAAAAGLPVIAYRGGAATETIKEGVTGLFFDHQQVDSLVKAISSFTYHTWYDKTIQEHARNFDKAVFQQQLKTYVEAAWINHQQECA